jgi:hypothetical protein
MLCLALPLPLRRKLLPVVLLGAASLAASVGFAQPELPAGPNRELVLAMCSGCHSLYLVVQNRMDRGHWDKTLRMMEERHKLTFFDAQIREKILTYLAEFLAPQTSEKDGVSGLAALHLNPLPLPAP